MNCPECDREMHGIACSCGWAKPGAANKVIWRSTESPKPTDGITREQFGVTLYHAIELIGGIMQLRVFRGRVAMDELPKSYGLECKAKEHKLIEELRSIVMQLKADDVTELVNRYPWVAAC